MAEDVVPISVSILDKDYRIACPDSEQASLIAAASELDSRMRAIRNAGKVIGTERVAVMAAINITHELLTERQRSGDAQALAERIRALTQGIEQYLAQHRDRV